MFTLWYNDMLDVISKQKMVKLVAADFTAKIREQRLGVAAANTREEDAKVPLARRAKAAEPGPTHINSRMRLMRLTRYRIRLIRYRIRLIRYRIRLI